MCIFLGNIAYGQKAENGPATLDVKYGSLSTDGNLNPDFTLGSCSHSANTSIYGTAGYVAPWWEVDLGHLHAIIAVQIFNRKLVQGKSSFLNMNLNILSLIFFVIKL